VARKARNAVFSDLCETSASPAFRMPRSREKAAMTKANVDTSAARDKLNALAVKVRASAAQAVQDNTKQLLARVQDKLSGEVLNIRSGALLRSIVETGLNVDAAGVGDSVASDGSAAYARIRAAMASASQRGEIPRHHREAWRGSRP
jgi:hypothetical protein